MSSCETLIAHGRDGRMLIPSSAPTVKKLCPQGAFSRKGEHETGSSSKGTTGGQRSPIDLVIRRTLIEASGILLDLWWGLEY
jgi:hypothetical protein